VHPTEEKANQLEGGQETAGPVGAKGLGLAPPDHQSMCQWSGPLRPKPVGEQGEGSLRKKDGPEITLGQ
jgi:hypothetical protein